jgi:hypothetical protein
MLASTRNICCGGHMDVADLLASASSGETSLGAAVFTVTEFGTLLQSRNVPKVCIPHADERAQPMFQSAAAADHHAFRCCTSALHVYN